jgi:hypothetical protein
MRPRRADQGRWGRRDVLGRLLNAESLMEAVRGPGASIGLVVNTRLGCHPRRDLDGSGGSAGSEAGLGHIDSGQNFYDGTD